jgi:hypothetical protein
VLLFSSNEFLICAKDQAISVLLGFEILCSQIRFLALIKILVFGFWLAKIFMGGPKKFAGDDPRNIFEIVGIGFRRHVQLLGKV